MRFLGLHIFFSPTRPSGPGWSSSHRVCVSVCLCVCLSVCLFVCVSVCLFVPFPCNFFWGLSLVLRSHDLIPASHWSTLLHHCFGSHSLKAVELDWWHWLHTSKIRHEDFLRPSYVCSCVTLRPPPLDSETGWTGELCY